jgi:hypothetical protein
MQKIPIFLMIGDMFHINISNPVFTHRLDHNLRFDLLILNWLINNIVLEIRGKQMSHELTQTGGKGRKIRRKQNIISNTMLYMFCCHYILYV